MFPHQERVLTEFKELNEKVEKLLNFVKSDIFRNLEEEDRELFNQQLHYMQHYELILIQRIARF